MTNSLDIRVLGPLKVEDGSRPIDLGPPKQRAVFAVLLLNANRIVSTERLIDEVWGADPPRTAAHSVQIYVSNLRKALDGVPASIETKPPGYLLAALPQAVDALRFEEAVTSALADRESGGTLDMLQAAMRMWNGDPLADFAYDEFAQEPIRRLHGLYARAAERLAELTLNSGEPEEALTWLDELGNEGISERAHSLRVLALYRSGRQLDALRHIDGYRKELAEAGLTLSETMLELEDMVISRDIRLNPPGRAAASPNPYKGLSPFTEDDAGRMFGRELLIGSLVELFELGSRFVAVVGPSGCGKSSVVRAGVVPQLLNRSSACGWKVGMMTPGEAPLERLESVLPDTGDGGPRLILVDQFEEVFVLSSDDHRDAFLIALEELAGDGRTRILLAMRADHLDDALTSPRFAEIFAAGMHAVTPMSADDLRRAITMPAHGAGVDVEAALVERIVADMEREPAALPLMQYTLTELFDDAVGDRLTLDAYDDLGGIKGALTKRAEELYHSLTVADRGRLRRILLSLVHANANEIRRGTMPAADLVHSGGEATEHLLDQLTRHRLVSRDRDPVSGEAVVQLTHEALIDEWLRLRGWITANQADLNRRESLALHTQEWEEAGRDPIYLLGGRALAVYQEWARTSEVPIGEGATSYLAASRHHHDELEAEKAARRETERRQRRNSRLRLIGVAGLIAALAATATYLLGPSISRFFNPPPDVLLFTDTDADYSGSFNETIKEGWVAGLDATGFDGVMLAPDYTQRLSAVDDLADQGVGLIMLSGFPTLTPDLADKHPDTKFVEWDFYPEVPLPNVTYFNFRENEGSFLVGAAAALKSETGVVGFIGGVQSPVMERFGAGYVAGARAMNPDVVVLAEYLSDWSDLSGFSAPSRAKAVAEEMYRQGADVIFHASGLSGVGLYAAAEEQSEELGRHLWAIGVDADEYHAIEGAAPYVPWDVQPLREHILTSMLKRIDVAVETAMREYAAGRLEPGVRVLGVAEGGVDYSRSGGFVADIAPQLEALRLDIISGRIVVPDR